MSFTLEDLGLAYRKAKVDLYYSSHASIFEIVDYEDRLVDRLKSLHEKLNGDDENWVVHPDFLGDWTLATKSIRWPNGEKHSKEHGNGPIFSSPTEKWEHACAHVVGDEGRPEAEFRVMAQCSLDFHVLSALWMLKVGHLFDAKLNNSAYGNRLRRTQDGKDINPLSLGSFVPYLKPFRDWRDRGITTMRTALETGKKIVALTADVSSFYHELNPGFMVAPSFIEEVLELKLSEAESKLNRLFIRALEAWARRTPLNKGLPVGLPASAVVANMALIELDRLIEKQVAPLYYGRYVDDIMLVMEHGAGFQFTSELWEWLFARSNGKLAWVKGGEKKEICFQPAYHKQSKSEIRFANAKNKVFMLVGETGKTLVDAIAHQIHERASEWRAMPKLPLSANHIGTDLLAATQSDGEAADNLRKADALTMRRASFAIKLRDFEAYERDLAPAAWKDHRHAFFRAFIQHVLVLPNFFELETYLPRVVRLATACEDFDYLRRIIQALDKLCSKVGESCAVVVKGLKKSNSHPNDSDLTFRWQKKLFKTIIESITAAFPPRLTKTGKRTWQQHMADYQPSGGRMWQFPLGPSSARTFQFYQALLFSADVAHMPFRFIGLPAEMVAQRGIPSKKIVADCDEAETVLPTSVLKGSKLLAGWMGIIKRCPYGLLFATRPFNLAELSVLSKSAYAEDGQDAMRATVLSLRGFTLNSKMPRLDRHGVLQIPDGESIPKYGVAVSSWKTRMESWVASVTRSADPDAGRYARLNRLLDSVISHPQDCRYLILPELALPAHWFIRIARKLHGRGVSLITGIEYLHAGKARVRNQVWAALSHDGLGFSSIMIYRQDKLRPALHEEQELQRLAGLEMRPEKVWKTPPIIQHGDLRFALLVCSELTNISYRAALRGQVDVLFVPEWNQDTETFNALVESAALDIHAYIVQCNDREYGDSRIRAPYKESWMRDILRVKGGISDYCVMGKIDVQALRQFQSSYRSPPAVFKPVPDGFAIQHDRVVLPM